MCTDIERELDLVRSGGSGGNALCALGLMAYTEFMGSLLPPSRKPEEAGARKIFDAFFRELGPCYVDLIDNQGVNVYKIFRCGLAHEYFVKGSCTIAMLNSTPGRIEVFGEYEDYSNQAYRKDSSYIEKPSDCGIGLAENGSYFFIVEKYFEDFRRACEDLLLELSPPKYVWVPPVDYPDMSDTG